MLLFSRRPFLVSQRHRRWTAAGIGCEFPPKGLPNPWLWLGSRGRFGVGLVWGQKAGPGSCTECWECATGTVQVPRAVLDRYLCFCQQGALPLL